MWVLNTYPRLERTHPLWQHCALLFAEDVTDLCWLSGNFPDDRLDCDQQDDVTGGNHAEKKSVLKTDDIAVSYMICCRDQSGITGNKSSQSVTSGIICLRDILVAFF